jgi:putative SOS response-associated peptidase YedK
MCTRAYHTYTADELFFRYLNRQPIRDFLLDPNYNMAPTHQVPIVAIRGGERVIELMRFGLVPPWEPDFSTKLTTFNARAETVFTSKIYRGPIRQRRCILPVSGFIEWQKGSQPRRPYRFARKDEPFLSVAAIWEAWHAGSPDERHSFAVITTGPNQTLLPIHDRMPVLLDRAEEEKWLSPETPDAEIAELLKPCPDAWLEAVELDTAINNVRNNSAELLRPKAP